MIQKKKTNRRMRKAFTLVELLVVIMIVAMLAGLVAPRLFSQVDKAKYDTAKPKMSNIETAIDAYRLNTGTLPETLEDLLTDPGIGGWTGPYVKASALEDPWGNEYIYDPEGTISGGDYDLISYGADGESGGEDFNADIYND